MVNVTEEINFKFYCIVVNLNINSQIVLDSTGVVDQVKRTQRESA